MQPRVIRDKDADLFAYLIAFCGPDSAEAAEAEAVLRKWRAMVDTVCSRRRRLQPSMLNLSVSLHRDVRTRAVSRKSAAH